MQGPSAFYVQGVPLGRAWRHPVSHARYFNLFSSSSQSGLNVFLSLQRDERGEDEKKTE